MPTQVQFRRGTSTQVGAFTGAAGEIVYDTEQKTLSVGDGTTPGGTYLSTFNFANAAYNEANSAYALATSITPFTGTSTLTDGYYSVILDANGVLNIPTSVSGNAVIAATDSIQLNANGSLYTFGTDGSFSFGKGVTTQFVLNTANTANYSASKANGSVQTAFVTVSANGTSLTPSSNNDTISITGSTSNGISIVANASTKVVDLGLRNSGVSAGTYGSGTKVPVITIDSFGRITSASNTDVSASLSLTGSDSSSGSITDGGTLVFKSNNGVLSTITGSNVTISTSQDLQQTASPTFSSITSNNSINIGTTNIVSITSNTYTTSSTSQVVVDSFPISTFRSAKYFVQMISSSDYHIIELNVVHDGTNTSMSQYGEVILGASSLGLFQASISLGNLYLLMTPTNAVTVVKLVRTTLMV
jgi:hypothetical protein